MKTRILRARIARFSMTTAAALALTLTTAVSAQLSSSIRGASQPLSQSDRQQVEQFVSTQTESLQSHDTRTATDAKRRLSSALDPRSSSRIFRLAYGEILTPALVGIVEDEGAPMHARISSIHLLGTIATDPAASALQAPLESDVDAIRYAAATAMQLTFDRIRAEQTVFSNVRQRELELTRWLRDAMSRETEEHPLHAEIGALAAASNPADAVSGVTQGLNDQMKRAFENGADGRIPHFRQALQLALNRYVEAMNTAPNAVELQKSLVKSSVLAMHLALAQADENEESRRAAQYTSLVQTAENVLSVLSAQRETISDVSDAYGNGDYVQAATALEQRWLAPNGPIHSNTRWQFKRGELDEATLLGG